MKKQCVRCGVHIENGLRCKKCRSKVDLELGGITDKPFEYFFRHHLKRQRALDKKIAKELNSDL